MGLVLPAAPHPAQCNTVRSSRDASPRRRRSASRCLSGSGAKKTPVRSRNRAPQVGRVLERNIVGPLAPRESR